MSHRLHLAAAVLAASLSSAATAHDPGLSTAEWILDGATLDGTLTFHPSDLEASLDPATAGALAASALQVTVGGAPVPPSRAEVRRDGRDNVVLHASFAAPGASAVRVQLAAFDGLPRGHRHYLVAREAGGKVLAERLLDAGRPALELAVDRPPATAVTSSWRFLALGVEHILTGFDHLVFLLALIVAGGGAWRLAGTITAFTLAHSATLALAALGVVRLSPAIVEPLIALSIVYVSIENLLRREPRHRWLCTFAFGLIHGLGFATLLGELLSESSASSLIGPLVAFNAGVELGQLGVLALALPGLWLLARRPERARCAAVLASVVAGAAGLFWLVERTLL